VASSAPRATAETPYPRISGALGSPVERPPTRILRGACEGLFTPRALAPSVDMAQLSGGELEELMDRGGLPHEVVSVLAQYVARRGPTVVVLEDLHWADEATLDVLRLLGCRIDAIRALVLATFRDDGRAWVGVARCLRATAAGCLLSFSSHAIRKHFRDRGVCAGVAPESIAKRNSELVGIGDGALPTPSVPSLASPGSHGSRAASAALCLVGCLPMLAARGCRVPGAVVRRLSWRPRRARVFGVSVCA
jgi:hypothetical protein